MKLTYPIIIIPDHENLGTYAVEIPDLPGCATGGNSLAEALSMAEDAASGWVLTELEAGNPAPKASDMRSIKPDEPDAMVSIIMLDMDSYAAKYGKKAVRKNVTIPAWLDTWGEQNNVNYSGVLRDALENLRDRTLVNA
ncbi:type II toxin-antitoxin system HicB family antitoxin [Bifidobacterium catenulatum]|uniref:Type II toxin-antitoxin system HicB family antitoxin n=1 Tax=Bifidobacterium catenulatum subsp. kashiwanohense TaxID=630129 RepID=A0AA43P4I9_9BIFI|nr:type II toxin-antitoxin system HicB family antitoxin [Bifidobacterium catenulatum]MDH7889163.1 type II toxin-antitoxin system HicB family antitoxin [Bifidobacterium catenulatum subsp. kashiwanohense]